MTFRIRTVSATADGRRIVRDRDLAGVSLTIGRAADNGLHLPDLALDPHHAVLNIDADGRVSATATGSLGFGLNGRTVRSGVIDPAAGCELRFGLYRVALARDGDGAVLLTVEEVPEAEPEKAGFTLAGLLPGKRIASWLLALGILAAFLALPVWSHLTRGSAGHVTGDAAWSTGPLSLAHRTLGDRCEACHVRPFEAVRDATCLGCHKDLADHAAPERIAPARGSGSTGDQLLWSVAHGFGKPGPGACSDCHTEHEGAGRMAAPAQAFCADCHASLKDRLPDTALGNAADFGTLHPGFRPAVALTAGSDKLTRVAMAQSPREASGLTFPHELHLDPRGGAARMALRLGKGQAGLDCADCHHPTADGVRFQSIVMERDCGTCHSLAYDRVGATFRRLRHGDVDQMVADLAVAPRAAAPIVSGRRRPGEFANTGTYFARFAPPAGGAGLAAQALSRDGICGECHTPAAGGRFAVVPVTQTTRFLQHGWFSHKPHRQEKCSTCHAAERSGSSADLLLPDLQTCRACHLGEGAKGAKVPSGCAMCHNYHLAAQAPRGLHPGKVR